jgi:predicted nuclease with TOPRIM domain
MDDDIKSWWLNASEARVRNSLVAQKLPPIVVAQTVARVVELKKQRRKERIKSTVTTKSWEHLLDNARAERQTLLVAKSQLKKIEPVDQQRWEALCAYETVVAALIDRLRKVQESSEHTPKSFITFLKEETGRVIPNNGEHWTDYVKASDRQRITLMFDALPPRQRGKRKTPFERRITKAAHKAQRLALIERLNTDITSAEREYTVTKDKEEQRRLDLLMDDMYRAQHVLDKTKPTAPLPATWHGLIR